VKKSSDVDWLFFLSCWPLGKKLCFLLAPPWTTHPSGITQLRVHLPAQKIKIPGLV